MIFKKLEYESDFLKGLRIGIFLVSCFDIILFVAIFLLFFLLKVTHQESLQTMSGILPVNYPVLFSMALLATILVFEYFSVGVIVLPILMCLSLLILKKYKNFYGALCSTIAAQIILYIALFTFNVTLLPNIALSLQASGYLTNYPPVISTPVGDYTRYLPKLDGEIKRQWQHLLPNGTNTRVVVQFNISSTGQLNSLNILRAGDTMEANQAAVDAIKLSAPFESLPKEDSNNTLVVTYTFDKKTYYNKNNKLVWVKRNRQIGVENGAEFQDKLQ